jgi:hypothetical protein
MSKICISRLSGVNVDVEDETSVLECFQQFTDKDMWQLLPKQTNIYANQSLAANPHLKLDRYKPD